MSIVDARPTVEAPDDDPYLWLEETESSQALVWVDAQNASTIGRFSDGRFAADRDALKLTFDRPDNIPFPNRRGRRLFNPWQDAEHPRGLWRTTSLESFRSEITEWDVLIDVDALAAKEREDWVWRGGQSLPGTHDRAIVHLSRGGKDAVVLREFDLKTREFVADGFNLPEARSQVVWIDRDTLLLMSPLGPNMATSTCHAPSGFGGAEPIRSWPRLFSKRSKTISGWGPRSIAMPQKSAYGLSRSRVLSTPTIGWATAPEPKLRSKFLLMRTYGCTATGLS